MREAGTKHDRISITYFDGINSTVQPIIARKTELSHMENARASIIGVIEKREGQTVLGSDIDGGTLISEGNYGLTYFLDGGTASKGLIRVTSPDGSKAKIYFLNQSDKWEIIDNDLALGLSLSNCSFANVDGNLIIVNGTDNNRMINGDIGLNTSMIDSTMAGSIYNSPKANNIAFYKSRIYLADYFTNSGEELKTTILRSSYPMGIVSLLSGDTIPIG